MNKVRPIDIYDAASLIHDIEYLKYEQPLADQNMLINLAYRALPVEVAFAVKNVFGYETVKNVELYNKLRSEAQLHFRDILENHNLKFIDQRDPSEFVNKNFLAEKPKPMTRRPPLRDTNNLEASTEQDVQSKPKNIRGINQPRTNIRIKDDL